GFNDIGTTTRVSRAEAAAPQGLQLLHGEGLTHRLQRGFAPAQIRQRPRQDPAAPRDGNVRPAPAAPDHSPGARSRDRPTSVHDRAELTLTLPFAPGAVRTRCSRLLRATALRERGR